ADLRLGSEERRAVARFADRLTGELTRLLESDRPDWGLAFLIGMARLAALRESEATGRVVLLDAFPPEPEVVPRSYVRRHPDAMTSLLDDARDTFGHARARFRARDEIDAEDVAAVAAPANRRLEPRPAAPGDRDL